MRGLAEEPKNRFKSVQEFVSAFDQAMAASPGEGPECFPSRCAASDRDSRSPCAGLAWMAGLGSREGAHRLRARREPDRDSVAASGERGCRVKPNAGGQAPAEPAKAPERSPEPQAPGRGFAAYLIWVNGGRIKDTDDELRSVRRTGWKPKNRFRLRSSRRAFEIWSKQGKPTDAAGEAVREKNMRAAEVQLLKETEEEFRRHPID